MKLRSLALVIFSFAAIICAIAFWPTPAKKPINISNAEATGKSLSAASAPQPQLSPPTTQAGASDSDNASQRRTFIAMKASERRAILDGIKKEDIPVIFQIWLSAGRNEKDLMKQGAVSTTLAYAIRARKPSPEFFRQMHDFITDSSNSSAERSQLLGVLAEADTKESVDLLVHLAMTLPDTQLKQSAVSSITSVGKLHGDGTYHEELSPTLEQAWQDSQDSVLLSTLAIAIAELGSSRGTKLLLDAALSEAPQDHVRAVLARSAFEQATILNPNAVVPLAKLLADQPVGSPASKLAADTLASSGAQTAGPALLEWFRVTNENVAPIIDHYVRETKALPTLKTWESALDPNMSFRNEKNRQAIRAALLTYYENHGPS